MIEQRTLEGATIHLPEKAVFETPYFEIDLNNSTMCLPPPY